ncbi:MAG TPA: DUF1294 domain-containing protein [Clostridiales bacterium]|nr:DUF1294 domain-containing protein [Clostridiales bacterium]
MLIINLLGFVAAAADKHRARKKMWRIPEKYFFLISIFGGCPGVYLGFIIFRHKTRHLKFMLGIPLIFLVQAVLIFYVLKTIY